MLVFIKIWSWFMLVAGIILFLYKVATEKSPEQRVSYVVFQIVDIIYYYLLIFNVLRNF